MDVRRSSMFKNYDKGIKFTHRLKSMSVWLACVGIKYYFKLELSHETFYNRTILVSCMVEVTPFNLRLFALQARRLCFGLRNCFSFMLSCQLVLSAVMFLSSCFLLPPPFTGLHLLWLSCIIVPLLSLSLIGSPADQDLMTMMTGKNDRNFKVINTSL